LSWRYQTELKEKKKKKNNERKRLEYPDYVGKQTRVKQKQKQKQKKTKGKYPSEMIQRHQNQFYP